MLLNGGMYKDEVLNCPHVECSVHISAGMRASVATISNFFCVTMRLVCVQRCGKLLAGCNWLEQTRKKVTTRTTKIHKEKKMDTLRHNGKNMTKKPLL